MKKFFLYFTIFVFLAGLATLAWGFWEGKKIRTWANSAEKIKIQFENQEKEKNPAARFGQSSGKKMEDLMKDLSLAASDLDLVSREARSAKEETENLSAPGPAWETRGKIADFYEKNEKEAEALSRLVQFMNKTLEVANLFDKISADANIEEIRQLIGRAKSMNGEISTGALTADMKAQGDQLKAALEKYLESLDRFAAGEAENQSEIDSAYADFSQKEKEFFSAAEKSFDNFNEIRTAGVGIAGELQALKKVKFRLF